MCLTIWEHYITTDYIVNKLNKQKISYFRLNTEDLITAIGINFNFKLGLFQLIVRAKDQIINLNEVKSVYFRRPQLPLLSDFSISDAEKQLILKEIAYTLEGLYKILINKFWISPVFSIREAENKIYQLLLAEKLGFTIPNSIITNEKQCAEVFISENKANIIKPIKTGVIDEKNNEKVIFTSDFNLNQIGSLNRISYCPTYFQEKIEKKADLRVTVVGNELFAVKIHSQLNLESKTDWRKGSEYVSYEKFDICPEIKKQCIQLTKALNLNFGAIDFIIDQNDNYIFLEINPNGQWAWLEEKLSLPISDHIIKLLVKGNIDENW